jgi:carboxymethylenebutenolidase
MSEYIKVGTADGNFQAYLARPRAVSAPAVIVLQEIFGVNADIRKTCDELAALGFLAIAPDLFWRSKPGLDLNSWSDADWSEGLKIYDNYNIDTGILDVAKVIETARNLSGSTGKVAVMGFCLGGLMSFLTAARCKCDAAVEYYGGKTEQYLDEAHSVGAPLMIHLGEEDEFISKDAQKAIKAAFSENPNVSIFSYPGCSHAFARHTGTHYDAAAAREANTRTAAFLTRFLF